MWRKIPLNSKIIISLLFVQFVLYTVVAGWLISWNQELRIRDIERRVDIQTDFIEDLFESKNGFVLLGKDNEYRREIEHESNIYYVATDSEGQVIDRSSGVSKNVSQALEKEVVGRKFSREMVRMIVVQGQHWAIQSELVSRPSLREIITYFHIAINVQDTMNDIENFRYEVAFAAILLALCSAFVTAAVVSYSTRNLSRFASRLRSMNPLYEDILEGLKPMSRDEYRLLDSYSKMIKKIRENDQAQKLFVAHASHELKTPVANALMIAEVALNRPRSNTEYVSSIQELFKEAKTLKRLTSGLLGIANLESELKDGDGSSCHLLEVIDHVRIRWVERANQKAIEIHVSGNDCQLYGSLTKWEIILGNLLDNAIKYGKQGGHVYFVTRVSENPEFQEIVIEDDGMGISNSDLTKMGDMFFRGDKSRNDSDSFGLGFAYMKRIVERLGGTLRIESEIGNFTRITLTARLAFPAYQGDNLSERSINLTKE